MIPRLRKALAAGENGGEVGDLGPRTSVDDSHGSSDKTHRKQLRTAPRGRTTTERPRAGEQTKRFSCAVGFSKNGGRPRLRKGKTSTHDTGAKRGSPLCQLLALSYLPLLGLALKGAKKKKRLLL